jgi:hypothetical integral membrane protein (TIGR02206 family)
MSLGGAERTIQYWCVIDATFTLAEFKPFSVVHLLVLAGYVSIIVALCWLGARWRGTTHAHRLHAAWLAFVVLVQVINVTYWCSPPQLRLSESLPLHICDLAGIAAVIDLLSRHRVWRCVMYYWGIGLSTQAFLTPIITDGPDTFRFHLFFASHLTIIATGCYDLFVRGFRPGWTDLRTILLVTLAWMAVVLPLDIIRGWNYGYVGNTKPLQPTLIDRLGPWPLRLLWMGLIVSGVFTLLTVVWRPWRRSATPNTAQTTP